MKRELSGLIGAQRENIYMFTDREIKMAKNSGICAAHTCIPQYREYPPGMHCRGYTIVLLVRKHVNSQA